MNKFSFVISIVIVTILSMNIICVIGQFSIIAFGEMLRKFWMKKHGSSSAKKNNDSDSKSKVNTLRNLYFGIYRNVVTMIGLVPSNFLRIFFYKNVLKMVIGRKVFIHKNCEIRNGIKITIGEGTIVGDYAMLDGNGGIEIGNNVNISSRSSLYSSQHLVQSPTFEGEFKKIKIGNRAWISSNTVVLPGVTIGEGAVLASGGIATNNLDSFMIYGGVPAKIIKKRSPDLSYYFDGKGTWFN